MLLNARVNDACDSKQKIKAISRIGRSVFNRSAAAFASLRRLIYS